MDATAKPALRRVAFWYLRHGETDWNAQGLSQGNVDIPLNENGLAQAREAGALLKGRGIRSIVVSSMGRAQQTAQIVSDALGLPFTTDRELREAAFGDQEGKPLGDWYDRWVVQEFTPKGAEDFNELRHRAVGAVNRALDNAHPILIVAHGALFRALRAEMGHSATVRTANGAAMFCEPAEPAWNLLALTRAGLAPS